MRLNNIIVLLTGCGAPGAPGIIKCLRNNGERKVTIIGVDANELNSGRRLVDKFYHVPTAESEDYIQIILHICKEESVQIIIPIVTRELMTYAKNISVFESIGVKVSVMSEEVLKIVNDKFELLTYLKEHGMKHPNFVRLKSVLEFKYAAGKMGYPERPICVKYAKGNGSRGIRIIDANRDLYYSFIHDKPNSLYVSFDEMSRILAGTDSLVDMFVMEYLSGEEYGVDALCDEGEILYMSGRRNIRVNSSIPLGSVIEKNEEAFEIAREIIKDLQISGNINFDYIFNDKGNPMLIEINPRLSATIVFYAVCGINYPYLQVKRLLGEELPNCFIRNGVIMQRHYEEDYYLDDERLSWNIVTMGDDI